MAKTRKPQGTLSPLRFESKLLLGNPQRDPHVRTVPIYLPPTYFTNPGRRFPTVYLLSGFTGRGRTLVNDQPFGEHLTDRFDRLITTKRMKEAIVVMPDCFTRWGGSQYLNSIANGPYEDHLVKELVQFVDRNYRTISRAGCRAIVGKSSGGYGALVQGMKHPDTFGLVACHSGDMYFELCYKSDFPFYLHAIRRYGGTKGFLKQFPKLNTAREGVMKILNIIAMAAAYSPRKGWPPFELPFDEKTGRLKEEVWREWLRMDPVHMLDRYKRNLKKLKLLFLDCGNQDEFHLHFGARILAEKLGRLRIRYTYEEFPDGHMNIQYRYDRSLPLITRMFERPRT